MQYGCIGETLKHSFSAEIHELLSEELYELCEVSKGKTLIAVTHDDRLAKYFDVVIDMNEVTSGISDSEEVKESKGGRR